MSDWKNVQYKDGKMRTSEGGGGGGSSTFAGLDDVDFSNLQDGQVAKYDAQNEKWVNADESGGGGTVTDVQVDGVSVVNQQGVAEIEMPTPPTIPVEDVLVNGTSVVDGNKEAQIKSYKEVTQAEYNALPASKESDGILYCIKDALGGVDGFPPLIYSDEEREVGVWRDGKPLYQKTVVFTGAFYGSVTVGNINTPNIDTYAEIKATILDITNAWKTITFSHPTASNNHGFFINPSGDLNLRSQLVASNALNKIQLTIQYTKTTDVAGSGQWTTSGTSTHHYSTSEQVIGTWIDGKPLYEKTVSFTVATRGLNNYAHGISNVKFVTSVNGVVLRASDNTAMPVNMARTSSDNDTSMLIGAQAGSTNISIFARNSDAVNGTAYVTIQYTKTTD